MHRCIHSHRATATPSDTCNADSSVSQYPTPSFTRERSQPRRSQVVRMPGTAPRMRISQLDGMSRQINRRACLGTTPGRIGILPIDLGADLRPTHAPSPGGRCRCEAVCYVGTDWKAAQPSATGLRVILIRAL